MYDPIWATKDGRQIRIGSMTDSHLANCIAKIERSGGRWRGEYLERLRLEVEIRAGRDRRRA